MLIKFCVSLKFCILCFSIVLQYVGGLWIPQHFLNYVIKLIILFLFLCSQKCPVLFESFRIIKSDTWKYVELMVMEKFCWGAIEVLPSSFSVLSSFNEKTHPRTAQVISNFLTSWKNMFWLLGGCNLVSVNHFRVN